MNQDVIIKMQVGECVASLYSAIQNAGGNVREDILTMSLGEVIADILGQNGIRFVFDKSKLQK